MIKKFLRGLVNFIILSVVVTMAIAIATIALTKKVNENAHRYNNQITATVIKPAIPVVSLTGGVVEKINVSTGQLIKKGDTLIILTNQDLQAQISALSKYKDNVSAQTQLSLAKQQLQNLTIKSPENGVVGEINVVTGSTVQSYTPLLTIYSNTNAKLLAKLTTGEYQVIAQLHKVKVYDSRLNQSFYVLPDLLNPSEEISAINFEEKKIGQYFKFSNPENAEGLLNNEDLMLEFGQSTNKIMRPIDYFANFWNNLLSK